jgi:hypothetical protein
MHSSNFWCSLFRKCPLENEVSLLFTRLEYTTATSKEIAAQVRKNRQWDRRKETVSRIVRDMNSKTEWTRREISFDPNQLLDLRQFWITSQEMCIWFTNNEERKMLNQRILNSEKKSYKSNKLSNGKISRWRFWWENHAKQTKISSPSAQDKKHWLKKESTCFQFLSQFDEIKRWKCLYDFSQSWLRIIR